MKKILLMIIFLSFIQPCFGVELLVKAIDSPLENGSKVNDIIAVRPDGWNWGKEECLPLFIVVKYPGVSAEEFKGYDAPLMSEKVLADGTYEIIKNSKYSLSKDMSDSLISYDKSIVIVKNKDLDEVKNSLTEKTSSSIVDSEVVNETTK